jgi:hypothetical protein
MDAIKPDLLTLPWPTFLTIISGYVAYHIANIGRREHHKTGDIVVSTVVFGFFAAFAYNFCRIVFEISLVWSSVVTFALAILLGAGWATFGRRIFEGLLRKSNVTHSDDLPSAWIALASTRRPATQLTVKLKDGSWLMCDNLKRFATSPNGPCVLGAKGDILMYVTHTQSEIGVSFFSAPDPLNDQWGHEITYIPADQIARVDLRREP